MKRTYWALVHPNHATPDAGAPRLYTREVDARRAMNAARTEAPHLFRIVQVKIDLPGDGK